MKTLLIITCLLGISIGTGVMAADEFPFREYPARAFQGKPASPRLETDIAWQHRAVIHHAAKHGPNFAGHYTVVDWGCGTSCAIFIVVNARSGRTYEPPEISKGVDLGVTGPEFRRDSTLMVVASCPNPRIYGYKQCERKLYNWNGSRLILLRTEPVTPSTTAR
jgi:hypothetical protein